MINNEILLKLVISAILGLAIGLERQFKRKPIGLKTSLVISISSCLLTIVSIESSYTFTDSEHIMIRMDPLRLAAQIVYGVGFLGAGVILKRDDNTISGLTAAAIIWGAAGIGIANGAGFIIEAITVVISLILGIELVPFVIKKLSIRNINSKDVTLKVHVQGEKKITVINQIKKEVIEVSKTRIKEVDKKTVLIYLKTTVSEDISIEKMYNIIYDIDYITKLEIAE